jgi:pimeloyl-ACP methyl ester carboxylesterase
LPARAQSHGCRAAGSRSGVVSKVSRGRGVRAAGWVVAACLAWVGVPGVNRLLWSVAMNQRDVGGQRIAYRESGTGPPLVLLHGWPLDSREFSRQLDGLADEFRVVAWDAPGAGRSSDPPATSRLEDWAHWLAEFIEVVELAPAHVAGLSFGGGLALELFRQHPDVVRSLILMSAYAGWGGSLSGEEVQRRVELTLRNTELPPTQWAPALIATLLPEGSDAGLADELGTMIADVHPSATRIAIQAFAEADLTDTLVEVDVPTLLLYGGLDVRSPREVWEPIHAGIAQSRLVVIPDAGHMVDMQAAERCNAEIRAFLCQADASGSIA